MRQALRDGARWVGEACWADLEIWTRVARFCSQT